MTATTSTVVIDRSSFVIGEWSAVLISHWFVVAGDDATTSAQFGEEILTDESCFQFFLSTE
jgi:hypothetical protein